MKITYRILLINLIIVFLILGSSAFVILSIMQNILNSQRVQNIQSSQKSFLYVYLNELQKTEYEFTEFYEQNLDKVFQQEKLQNTANDFIFKKSSSQSEFIQQHAVSEKVALPKQPITIKQFLVNNPYAIVKLIKDINGDEFYFGKVINQNFLEDVSLGINADIAMLWDGNISEISNAPLHSNKIHTLSKALKYLSDTNNKPPYIESDEEMDVVALLVSSTVTSELSNNISFLIFKSNPEIIELRDALKIAFGIIGVLGFFLSIILTYLFTNKIRLQITELSHATEEVREGNFSNRIEVKTKDEIGRLGGTFNVMLDELNKNQKAKAEYADFITLINQNPSLVEISNAALKKIISTCNFTVGALYSVDEGEISLISSYGMGKRDPSKETNEYYQQVIRTKDKIEINSGDLLPIIPTGTVSLWMKYLLIIPVVYNNNVIAILEFGSVDAPTDEARDYLSKIQEQLAIGITNAKAVVQLESFINELKRLNEDYQKQNVQIRKQNETLVNLHKELEKKASELEIQKEKAEESTRLKSQFLASMSHELRTPMNSILGLTELILEKAPLGGKNKERLEVVFNSGKRLMRLINDILDLSKIESGRMEIRDEDVLIEELIEEVSTTISPLITDKGLRFEVKRECNTRIIINTDRTRLTQVLINLLGNATKFTERGKVTLVVSQIDSSFLQFNIIDTGIGISEYDQRLIFDEFRQIDGTTTRKYSGTGLGLTICKKIVDLLGGTISLTSNFGEGSNFSFTIPLKIGEAKTEDKKKEINLDALRKNRKNPILVIDDDAEIRYTIGQYLFSRGYEAIFAKDGESGIKMARERQPFAITLDVMLPNKDGWTVLKELKEDMRTKDIPVILVSILGDKKLGYGLGAFEYFVKPISSEKLLSAFSNLESLVNKRVKKIVIVDNDEQEFERYKSEFKDEEISIEYIQDSEFAFNKIAEVQPDLVILDLIMAKVDGVTLSHKLKSNLKTKHIPIIISTAKNLSDEERSSLNDVVEEITVKSKEHSIDVLKVVRDRIKLQESDFTTFANNKIGVGEIDEFVNTPIESEEENVNHIGEVLIIDDDPDTLFTLNEIVQSAGCKTILARSGFEGLKLLGSHSPDLVLLDIMMPDMDGFQTLTNIRANSKFRDLCIYAVTAKAMSGDKEIILKHGFNDYIAKPINTTIIKNKIEQALLNIKSKK